MGRTRRRGADGLRDESATAGPFTAEDLIDHCVPADKKLSADWLRTLTDRGEPTWYRGTDLVTIGMPVGGIGAGQLYLTGDGRLAHWDIFNLKAPGYLYPAKPVAPVQVVEQGFAIRVRQGDQTQTRALDSRRFPECDVPRRVSDRHGQVRRRAASRSR